jgi:hypothetical protein
MLNRSWWKVTFVLLGLHAAAFSLAAETILDFEEFSLAVNSFETADASEIPLISGGVSFNRVWNTEFACCPAAWTLSNATDLHTPGFDTLGNPRNEFSAYHMPAGGGAGDSTNFLVAFGNESRIDFPSSSQVRGMFLTNTTYAYRAIAEGVDSVDEEGNDHRAFVKGVFEDGDWFKLSVQGYDAVGTETGEVEFYLADYRAGQQQVVAEWTWLDLASLGEVRRLNLTFSSSDVGPFGMNTPAYVAMDRLTFAATPEPSLGFWTAVILGWFWRRVRFGRP